jgi:cytochrome P450
MRRTFSSCAPKKTVLACIKETLRHYPPVPGSMPRVVPEGGATVAGHFVPQGTVVSVAQWPTNHSARNFSQPSSFLPGRFLEPDRYPDDRPEAIQPFSIGRLVKHPRELEAVTYMFSFLVADMRSNYI